jgi:3-oxoacyl-[acyl-carrier protein] reductase
VRLTGRTALVTGASRGIGAVVAAGFAAEGAAVALNHLDTLEMRRLAVDRAADIVGMGGQALAVAADVSDPVQVSAMMATVRKELGPVDILVANAAADATVPWDEISMDEWTHMLSVNLTGAFVCARAVWPDMRSRGYGKIITVSSVMVELGLSGSLHYVTSKAGLIGFTRALAREVGSSGVRVNSVMPGAIRTEYEIERVSDPDALAVRAAERQSIPRRGLPDDLVGAFVYLAAAESDFVTGQVLTVDGGWANY